MVLTGWKEIAMHLRCGVRTAQRWETRTGLPVRRRDYGQVLAFSDEIDEWLRTSSRLHRVGDGKSCEVVVAEINPLVLKCSACQHRFNTSDREKLGQEIIAHLRSHAETVTVNEAPAA